jgi:branched-chain amino acid transport system substrate-binding protein
MTMISGVNTAPSLTAIGQEKGADWQPGYFRTVYNGAVISEAAATFAIQGLGLTKAATINDGDAFSQGFTDMFEQVFTDLGGEIVLSEKITKGETDMKPVLTAVAESGAEILFFPIFHPDGTLIVQQRKDVPGMEKITLISADALRVEPFLDEAGDDAVGVYFVGGAIAKETEVATEYEAKYNEPPQHATYGSTYDSVHLLLPVVEQVAIKDADGTLHIGRQALRDAMYAVPDYEGVTGTLSCDQFGDCGVNRFEVVQVDDPSTGLEGLKANVIYTYASE